MDSQRRLKTAFLMVVLVCAFCPAVFGQPWDGNGVEGDPYQIWTAADMQAIGASSGYWGAHFKLMADIDLGSYTGDDFNIIGTYIDTPRHEAFSGVFDGDNHTISNFSTSPRANSTGLFGYISGVHAEVRNVGLVEPEVQGSVLYTGTLVGLLGPGRVLGCWSEGGRVQGSNRTGGLVGKSSGGVICNSYSSTKVSGRDYTGGLVGYNGSYILNCYATGSVSGDFYVGGLAGHAGHVLNSFSSGTVSGRTVGGLLGEKYGSESVRNSFWDIESSGRTTSAGGTGLTTAEMQDMNTFLDAGWDFVGEYENGPSEDWAEPTGVGYPVLAWQVTPLPPLPVFSGGTGEANDPYLISTGSELNRIGHNPRLMSAHFKLVSDVDLSGVTFFNIANIGYRFGGVFDGNGHTIFNFTHSVAHKNFAGLFACVGSDTAQIRNLGLVGPNLYAPIEDYVGSLVGLLIRGSVTNCRSEGGQVAGHNYVGGLVGYNYEGLILECCASSQVSGEWQVGGLVGFNEGVVSKSFSQGAVTGYNYTGGLIGSLDEGNLDNSYCVGGVSGNRMVGGLVGVCQDSNIVKCYAGASVTGNTDLGGLVGRDYRSSYEGCFWDSDVNPDVNGIGNRGDPGVISKMTAEMQTESTFTSAGWDFSTPIWTICDGRDYPRLWWQVDLVVDIDIDGLWMYQNLPGQMSSTLTVSASSVGDPSCNSNYSYAWEIVLPGDVNLAPMTVDGGGAGDAYWTFAARGCDEPGGLSDSGQTFKVRVTVTGDDYGNTGQAEAEFGIALLGDVNNDGIVNVVDRSITNVFWRMGSAGPYTLRDCDVTSDGIVNVVDRSITNAVWRGMTGQNSVSGPCPLR